MTILYVYIFRVKNYFNDCVIFFWKVLYGTYIYFLIISTNFTIARSTAMCLHLIYYIHKMTLPFKAAISFITTIAFRGLIKLVLPNFFSVTFTKLKLPHLGIQL